MVPSAHSAFQQEVQRRARINQRLRGIGMVPIGGDRKIEEPRNDDELLRLVEILRSGNRRLERELAGLAEMEEVLDQELAS